MSEMRANLDSDGGRMPRFGFTASDVDADESPENLEKRLAMTSHYLL